MNRFCNKTSIYTVISIVTLIGMTVFMIAFASKQSFWLDELDWTIGVINGTSIINKKLFTNMFQNILEHGYNLPLVFLLLAPLYTIMPYGEVWLLIPSILLVVTGIIILSKAGKLLGGEDLGFFTLCIAVTSSTLIIQGGWEIRPYALTFCFSSLTLFTYIKRLQTETHNHILLYGIALLLLLYSHWFGSILALFYALTDLYLWFKKKIGLRCIASYMLAGMFFVPWFVLMLRYHIVGLGTYWASVPRIFEPIFTVAYLLSNTIGYCLLFAIGFVLISIPWILSIKKQEKHKTPNIWVFLIMAIAWTILPIFVYSKWINPGGSNYVNRYFFVLIPHVLLISAYGISSIWNMPTSKLSLQYLRYGILVFVLISAGYRTYHNSFTFIHTLREPYREVAEYLAKDESIYADDSLVLVSSGSGWIEYYFRKRGYPIPANVAVGQGDNFLLFIKDGAYSNPVSLKAEQITAGYTRLYLFEVHEAFSEACIETIKTQYTMVEDFPQFKDKIPESTSVIRFIKKLIRYQPRKEPVLLFGLRIYHSPVADPIAAVGSAGPYNITSNIRSSPFPSDFTGNQIS